MGWEEGEGEGFGILGIGFSVFPISFFSGFFRGGGGVVVLVGGLRVDLEVRWVAVRDVRLCARGLKVFSFFLIFFK
jgi:hypothetical protein